VPSSDLAFEFSTAGRIVFGRGAVARAPAAVRGFGVHGLLVVGKSQDRHAQLLEALRHEGIAVEVFHVPAEPTTELIRRGTDLARRNHVEVVVGFGGGSALDAAKSIALLTAQPGDVLDYLEVIGAGRAFERPGLPTVAIPTTAGTGTEVTRNAVLASPEHSVKVSVRSPDLLPRLAIVDPDLSSGMPPELTARVGCDALTQLIEPFVSHRASPFTDAVCREGLRRGVPALRRAVARGDDREAREAMAVAATLSGVALANAGLGVIHGLAGPIGGMIPAPHGAICAALLPSGMDVNLRALRRRMPGSAALHRYDELGEILSGRAGAAADEAVVWAAALVADLAIPPLSSFGLTREMVPAVVERGAVASSTRGNPIVLDESELTEIVSRAL
jgi:alcohol dehydrogenase class IV